MPVADHISAWELGVVGTLIVAVHLNPIDAVLLIDRIGIRSLDVDTPRAVQPENLNSAVMRFDGRALLTAHREQRSIG